MKHIKSLYAYEGNVPKCGRSRTVAITVLLSLSLVAVACGPSIALFRAGILAVSPAVEYAIAKGLISRDRADLYRGDATKLLNGYEVLTVAWKAAPDKAAKLLAIQAFANETLAPIAGDFTKVPQLAEAMLILNTVVAVLEGFYGGSPPSLAPGVSMPKTEGELKKYLETQSKKLKAALEAR